jgi:large subunit ribosomal protein L18
LFVVRRSLFVALKQLNNERRTTNDEQIEMNPRRADLRRAVHTRIRKKVRGTAERPRLAIYRSLNHIYAQVSASTTEKDLRGTTGGNLEAARLVGRTVAERALAAGVSNVVFDRGGYVYHGRVKALTDAAREAGLNKGEAAAAEANGTEGSNEE